jgi:tetratricopeptide (TPR) repeat protein
MAASAGNRTARAERVLQEAAVLMRHGNFEEAVRRYRAALKLAPQDSDVHYNLGIALARAGRHEEALASLRRSLAIGPGAADAHVNIGDSLQALGRHADAIASYAQALVLQPDLAEAHNNGGNALQALGRYAEALPRYEKAIAARPGYAVAICNLGNTLRALDRQSEALECYRRAQEIDPQEADPYYYEAVGRLRAGDFAIGWAKYEWRWRRRDFPNRPRNPGVPLWLGQEDLGGKTILLHAEQGLGDCIQFVRYAPLVAARGASVVLEVYPALVGPLASLRDVAMIVAPGSSLPRLDFHCPLMSLPLAFRTTLQSVPGSVPYLSVAADRIAHWRGALALGEDKLIGIAWSGNPKHDHGRTRDMSLACLESLLRVPRTRFVSLQKELSRHESQWLKQFSNVSHPGESFDRTAEMIGALDLVISVDTAWVHWAGAIGKPVWVLLATDTQSDWRWMTGRNDSPWYPTARLFRQPAFGDWSGAVEQAARTLAEFVAS